jgi:hypothetical protein
MPQGQFPCRVTGTDRVNAKHDPYQPARSASCRGLGVFAIRARQHHADPRTSLDLPVYGEDGARSRTTPNTKRPTPSASKITPKTVGLQELLLVCVWMFTTTDRAISVRGG